jgi:hypothetical protein
MIIWSSFACGDIPPLRMKCCRYSLGTILCFTGSAWCPIGLKILGAGMA